MCAINLANRLTSLGKRLTEPYVNTSVNLHFISLGIKALSTFWSHLSNSGLQLKDHLIVSVLSELVSQDED